MSSPIDPDGAGGSIEVLPRPAEEFQPDRASPKPHIYQLDGWRGISILSVLAAHMLPLGPKSWNLNYSAALFGMAVFFTLSGYLITSFLMVNPNPKAFLIRRSFRILPLAWLFLALNLIALRSSPATWAANLGFTINYQFEYMLPLGGMFWSLCAEVHFYLFAAVLVAVMGRRGLWLLVPLCIAITLIRVTNGVTVSIKTHLRVDEILAGACVALLGVGTAEGATTWPFRRISPWVWAVAAVMVTNPRSGPLQYCRPYVAALLVGSTLAQRDSTLTKLLCNRSLFYLAGISYALYVIHPIVYAGWMNRGATWARYLVKRPISFAALFALAHLSTKYYESYWIALGKRLTTPARRLAP